MLTQLRNDTMRSLALDAIEGMRATRESHPQVFEGLEAEYGRVEFDAFDAHPLGLFDAGEGRFEATGSAYFRVGGRRSSTSEELEASFRGRLEAGCAAVETVDIAMPG